MMYRNWKASRPFRTLRRWFGIQPIQPFTAMGSRRRRLRQEIKRDHPVGYWLTEVFPEYLQKIPETFIDPIHKARYYYRNRWVRQTHVLPTRFPKGEYHDLDERLLHGCMEALVDFVEIEKSWRQSKKMRSPKDGLAYLSWEMSLNDEDTPPEGRSTSQALAAREIYAIYLWWKSRPDRLDTYEASGYNEIDDLMRRYNWGPFEENSCPPLPEFKRWNDLAHKAQIQMDQDYEEEDEAMLHRLIKIRLSLWT